VFFYLNLLGIDGKKVLIGNKIKAFGIEWCRPKRSIKNQTLFFISDIFARNVTGKCYFVFLTTWGNLMKGLFKRSCQTTEKTTNKLKPLEHRFLTGIYGGGGEEPIPTTEQEEIVTTTFIGIGGVKKPPP
jgi:hypothetical protein